MINLDPLIVSTVGPRYSSYFFFFRIRRRNLRKNGGKTRIFVDVSACRILAALREYPEIYGKTVADHQEKWLLAKK